MSSSVRRGVRAGRRRPAPHRLAAFDRLEDRAVPTLVVGPIAAVEDIPFFGKVATLQPADVQGAVGALAASITWGDSTATPGTVVPNGQGGYDVDTAAPKTYTQFGTFPVTVTGTGTNNSAAFGRGTATVNDAPLTPNPTPTTFTATAGQTFAGVIGSFQDVNTASTPADFAVTVLWGDGRSSVGSVAAAGAGRFNVTGAHTYASAGTAAVQYTVVRVASGQTFTSTATADVLPSTIQAVGTTLTAAPGQPLTGAVVAAFVDSSLTSVPSDFTATIRWGAGLPTTTGAVAPAPGPAPGSTLPGRFLVVGTFTYPAPGAYTATVTINRVSVVPPSGNPAAVVTTQVIVAAPTLAVFGTSIRPTAGTQFVGTVASFADTNPGGTAQDFTATINWGASQATTPGAVVPAGPGRYNVVGVYTYPSAGSFTVHVTVTRAAGGQSASADTAAVVAPALTAVPAAPLTATARQLFTGPVATFVDASAGSVPGGFLVAINWGDGQVTPGQVVAGSAAGVFSVIGTHTYAAPGVYPVTTAVVRTSDNRVLAESGALAVYAFGGGLDPLSASPPAGSFPVTFQNRPLLSGTAEPNAVVVLSVRAPFGADALPIGETVANAAGAWSLTVGPLANGAYQLIGVEVPTTGVATSAVLLNGGAPLVIRTSPLPGTPHHRGHARHASPSRHRAF